MDELARLVVSLTKAEKRYFKMLSSMQNGEKSYLKLFEAIEKIKDYDEDKIKKMLRNEEFIKRLPAVKNYLYSQVLKSLRVIYGGSTTDSKLKEMMEDVTILFEKRLYKQCIKILERAKILAEEAENNLLLIEINGWEEKILNETSQPEKFEKMLDENLSREIKLLETQKNLAYFRNLYHRIVVLNKKIKEARTEEELASFQEIINNPLLSSIDNATSFEAKNYFYMTHLIYHHAKGDNETCFTITNEKLQLIESFPKKIEENPKLYISTLNNLLLCQIHLHRYINFDETLKKLRNFSLTSLSLKVARFVSSYTFEMVKYLDTGEFSKSAAIRKEIEDGLLEYSDRLNRNEEITLLYNLFYSYFGTAEYPKALNIINRLQNEYQKDMRYDIQSAVRLLNLILHYELGNTRLIEYASISAFRYLAKSKRLYKMENIVLNFIRKKIPDMHTAKEKLEAFRELRKEFVLLAEDPYEKKALEYFDYIAWLDSKIEGKSFEEITTRKFRETNGNAAAN